MIGVKGLKADKLEWFNDVVIGLAVVCFSFTSIYLIIKTKSLLRISTIKALLLKSIKSNKFLSTKEAVVQKKLRHYYL